MTAAGRPDNTEAALYLVREGYNVYPLRPGSSKEPAFGKWEPSLATTHASDVLMWWGEDPARNVATLLPRSVVRVDIDVRDDVDGYQTLAGLERQYGSLPATRGLSTPRGGEHRFYRLPGDVERPASAHASAHLAPGVELLWGRWAPLPPTVRKDGEYRWSTAVDTPLADLPRWVDRLARDFAASGGGTCAALDGDAAMLSVLGISDRWPQPFRMRDGSPAEKWGGVRCPAHDDAHASAWVIRLKSGRLLVGCKAGCTRDQIRDAIGGER